MVMTDQNRTEVSVIIPTYNRAHLISRAINSVLNQTFKDFEIIIVDDASKDNTEEVIGKIADNRIKYYRNPRNEGSAKARNIGIKISSGRYIAFLDSDDEWLPTKLDKQVSELAASSLKIGVVYTGTWRIMGSKKFLIPANHLAKKEGNIYNNLLCGEYLVPTPAALVKEECFKKVGVFDESVIRTPEWDLWIRISKHFDFIYIEEPLVISHFTSGSLSTDFSHNFKSTKMIFKKHYKDIKKNKRALTNFYLKLARISIGYLLRKLGLLKRNFF